MNIPNGPSKLYLSGSFYPLIVNSEEIVCSEHLTSLKTEDRLILILKNVLPPLSKQTTLLTRNYGLSCVGVIKKLQFVE